MNPDDYLAIDNVLFDRDNSAAGDINDNPADFKARKENRDKAGTMPYSDVTPISTGPALIYCATTSIYYSYQYRVALFNNNAGTWCYRREKACAAGMVAMEEVMCSDGFEFIFRRLMPVLPDNNLSKAVTRSSRSLSNDKNVAFWLMTAIFAFRCGA